MDRAREISEATLGLLFQNYFVVLALASIILAFALYVYLYRRPLMSEYFTDTEKKAAAEKKDTEKTESTA